MSTSSINNGTPWYAKTITSMIINVGPAIAVLFVFLYFFIAEWNGRLNSIQVDTDEIKKQHSLMQSMFVNVINEESKQSNLLLALCINQAQDKTEQNRCLEKVKEISAQNLQIKAVETVTSLSDK